MLLATIFLAVFLPLLPYNANQIISVASNRLNEGSIISNVGVITLDEVIIRADEPTSFFQNGISLASVLLIIYSIGVLFKSIQFFVRIYKLRMLINYSETTNNEGLKFVYTTKGSAPYSFFHWLFIDPELIKNKTEFNTILSHEKIHAEQGHSYDLIVAEILAIIQWFNPLVYLLKKNIKENHEYITDHEIITNFQDANSYQILLLKHSSILKANILTHNFSYSLLKRRLNIMKKTKNPITFGLRLALLSASLILIFFACSSPEEEKTKTIDIPNTKAETVNKDNPENPVFLAVEDVPEFVGGESAMLEFIKNTIKYPDEAKKEGIQGRVFISFIVEKDGQISNVEVLRGIGGGCDEEAMRVVKSMPNWTPGQQRGNPVRVQFRMPIKFALQ